jgi:hypothetical protein
MPNESDRTRQSTPQKDEYMRGGKGRKDEVGRSGIYPASAANAPADAEPRSQGDFVRHEGAPQKRTSEQGPQKTDQTSGSE